MPSLDLGDLSMHFERAGQGTALLLIPGALGTGAGDFPAQIPFFAQHGFEVIAPDPRGYGRSRPPEREYPLDFYARDAADMFALMAQLRLDRFVVLGWSDGANIATLMAADKPERIAKLVAFGGQSFLTHEEIVSFNHIRKISAWSPRAAETMRAIYGEELDELWDRYVNGQEALYEAGADLYQQRLKDVRCPTLILHGAIDPLVPAFHAEAIHRGIAGSRLQIFPEAKHNIHIRYAEEFNALVLAFISGTD